MPEPIAEIVLRDEVSEALRDWEKKLKDLSAPRETAKATGEFRELRDSVSKANREFGTLLKLTGAGAIIGAGFVATVANIGRALADFSRSRLSVHYLAQEVGVATQAFERLVAAGQGVGLTRQQSIADVSGFLGTLQELRARGPWSDVAQNLNWFGQAGFKLWSDLHRISRGPGGIGDAAEELFERMQAMRPEAQAAIMRMFNMSSIGWRDVDLTLVMRAATPSAQAMRDYLRALVYLDVAMGNVKVTIANALMPVFERLAIRLAEWLESPAGRLFLKWLEDVARAIERVDWEAFRVGMVTALDAVKGVVADVATQLGLMDPQVEKIGGWAPIIEGALVGGIAGWLVGVTSPLASLAAVGAALAGFAFLRGATTAPTMLGVLSTPSIKNQRGQTVGRATAGTNNASYSATRIKTQRGSDVSETSSERPYTADIGVSDRTVSRARRSTATNVAVDARVGEDGRSSTATNVAVDARVGEDGRSSTGSNEPVDARVGEDGRNWQLRQMAQLIGHHAAPARFVAQQFVETNRALSLAVLDCVHELARINDAMDATGFTVGEFGSGVNAIRSVLAGQGVPARGYRGGGGAFGGGGATGGESTADVTALADAIQKAEGWGPGTRSYRNNNPGNIEFGDFAKAHGAIGTDGRFARFPDYATGRRAMEALLRKNYGGMTIEQIGRRYVGAGQGQNEWIAGVSRGMGRPPSHVPLPIGEPGAGGPVVHRGGYIGGEIDIGGQRFPFGSGGAGGGHIPFGDYPITPGAVGPRGRAGGWLGINNNRIWDAELGRYREGIEIHPGASDHAITQGCIAIAGNRWREAKARVLEMIRQHGSAWLHVGAQGVSVTPSPRRNAERGPNEARSDELSQVGSLSASLARERSFVQRARQARLRARIRAPRNVDVRVDGDGAFAGNVAVERQVTSTLEPAEAEG